MLHPDSSEWWQPGQLRMSAIIKEVYDAFISAGVSDEQAAAAALAIPPSSELATKSDIRELRAEFKGDITELRSELKGDIAALHSEIRELRSDTKSDMKDLELRMTVKFFASVGLVIAGIKALDFLIG